MSYGNGTAYEGDWEMGTRQGHGILSYNCESGGQSRIYTGTWLADKPHGFGLRQYRDGGLYKGLFSEGKRHGYGCMYYPDGKVFMGLWVQGCRTGVGRLISYDTKDYYEGSFKNGVKSGRGRYYHMNTGQIQDGIWERNELKVSMMLDDKRTRPIAKAPTPYPIPLLWLDDPNNAFTNFATPVYERTQISRK